MVLELRAGNQTIINDVNFEYSLNMNENNRAIINLESNTSFQNSLLNLKAPISVYRNGVIEFKGKINSRSNLEGNATKLICNGAEQEYIKDNIDLSSLSNNGVYVNTASADIFEELIGNGGVTFSSGTIDTGINIDQKFSESNSWFSGILNLLSKTGQELFVNYSNDTLSIKDSLGTAEEIIGEGQTSISKIIDDFNRADSSTVGNGWIDIGTNPNKFQILNNQLYVDGVSFLEARIEKSLGKVYDISPIKSEFSFFIQRDFFTLGDPSGIELYENNTLKLRIRFGTVFGPTSINETDFYNSAGTKIETIPYNAITSTNPGTFQVLSNGGGSYTINHPDG
ncbi:MAG TPA: hypothetical protein DCL21_01655, partial [Alphaproteobacteria bacterium]|nr:hypothetical protein [Alphaproteobacteria bacterium]